MIFIHDNVIKYYYFVFTKIKNIIIIFIIIYKNILSKFFIQFLAKCDIKNQYSYSIIKYLKIFDVEKIFIKNFIKYFFIIQNKYKRTILHVIYDIHNFKLKFFKKFLFDYNKSYNKYKNKVFFFIFLILL